MGINGISGVGGVTGVYGKKGNLNVERPKEVEASKDVASISKSGQDFATAMRAIREIQDGNDEKLNKISAEYEKGEYNIPEEDIAKILVEKMFGNKA